MTKSLLLTAVITGFAGYFLSGWLADDTMITGNTGDNELTTQGENAAHKHHASHYVCPMHAEIVGDHEGNCPICGMDLVLQKIKQRQQTSDGLPVVEISSTVVNNLGVRTAEVVSGDLQRSIETIGKITRIDPMARRTITPPIRGELVYIVDKQQGDLVEAGELLFTVKSAELFEHEKAFQDAYQSDDRSTASAMIPGLTDMGLSSQHIAQLQAGDTPEIPVEVHAFEDGFIYTRRGFVGEKVHTGFTVFNVGGNYRVVEVTAEIFERQWGWVKEGQLAKMKLRGLPGTDFSGKVVRIEPPIGYTTRSLEVGLRFNTDNSEITQSMFAHVSITAQPRKNVLLLPADSVIRTGHGDRVVRVDGKNRFQPVSVVAGEEANGMIEIRSGLQAGDTVVASGQFLIDSESNIMAGFRRMNTPGSSQPPVKTVERRNTNDDSTGSRSEPDSMSTPVTGLKQPVAYNPASGL